MSAASDAFEKWLESVTFNGKPLENGNMYYLAKAAYESGWFVGRRDLDERQD